MPGKDLLLVAKLNQCSAHWFVVRGRHCASLRMIQEPLPGQVQALPQPGAPVLLGSGTLLGGPRSRGIFSCGVSCCSSG